MQLQPTNLAAQARTTASIAGPRCVRHVANDWVPSECGLAQKLCPGPRKNGALQMAMPRSCKETGGRASTRNLISPPPPSVCRRERRPGNSDVMDSKDQAGKHIRHGPPAPSLQRRIPSWSGRAHRSRHAHAAALKLGAHVEAIGDVPEFYKKERRGRRTSEKGGGRTAETISLG